MTPLERATDAAWKELERQAEVGKPGPYVDRDETSVIDGEVDMPALARAVLLAIREPDRDSRLKAWGHPGSDGEGHPKDMWIWQAMIDAALEEG